MDATTTALPDPGRDSETALLVSDHPAVAGSESSRNRGAGSGSTRRVAIPSKRLTLRPVVQTEAQVLRDVRAYLALHPKVSRIIRVNSGAAQLGDPEHPRFVRFCDIEGQNQLRHAARRSAAHAAAAEERMELVADIIGFLTDGRFLAVEVKRGDWKRPADARERAQERFLDVVRRSGGVAGFVASLRGAEELMKSA